MPDWLTRSLATQPQSPVHNPIFSFRISMSFNFQLTFSGGLLFHMLEWPIARTLAKKPQLKSQCQWLNIFLFQADYFSNQLPGVLDTLHRIEIERSNYLKQVRYFAPKNSFGRDVLLSIFFGPHMMSCSQNFLCLRGISCPPQKIWPCGIFSSENFLV